MIAKLFVILTWSIAQGTKQGTFSFPNINGNVEDKQGAAWTAGNAIFPMTSLSPNPNIPFTWLNVTLFWILIILA